MFKKILFATTASPTCDNAAKVAFDLAMKWDAQLYVFHVLGYPTRGFSPFIVDVRTGEVEEQDPDYTEWVKEEIKNTYDSLLEDSTDTIIELICSHRGLHPRIGISGKSHTGATTTVTRRIPGIVQGTCSCYGQVIAIGR